ncbi:MAG: PqqD family protein [Erysipelotrichaceae bacterium]|nr:PqqD family protein [Erysipelotrichaceae bacterium]
MKLSKNFVMHNTGEVAFLAPVSGTGFSGMVRGNSTFGVIIKLLQNDTTEEEIVMKIVEKYTGNLEQITSDVHRAVEQLREIGAIED